MPNTSKESRQQTAQTLNDLLLQVAQDMRIQQEELKQKFPHMTSLPPPLQIDPGMIEDFTRSTAYRNALDDYIRGRVQQNVMVTVLNMLKSLAPMLFGSL